MTMQNDEKTSGQGESLQHLLQKSAGLCSEGNFDESLAVYAEIEQGLNDDKNNPESRKLIAGVHVRIIDTLYEKCRFLLEQGAYDEVFSVCEGTNRFLNDADPDVRKISREKRKKIVEDIYEKSDFLLQNERADEASAVYGKIEQHFSKDDDPEVRSIVSRAFIKKYDAEKIAEKLAKKSAELAAEIAAIEEAMLVPEEASPPEAGKDAPIPQPEYPIESRDHEETPLLEPRIASLNALSLECSLAFKRGDWKKGLDFYDEIEGLFGEDENPIIQKAFVEVSENVAELLRNSQSRLLKELDNLLGECSTRFPRFMGQLRNKNGWEETETQHDPNSGCSWLFLIFIILFVIILVGQL